MKKLIKRTLAVIIVLTIVIPQTIVFAATSLNVKVTSTEDYAKAYEVLDLVNQERTALGLNELEMDTDLLEAAMIRASELTIVYDHTRPDGRSFYTILDDMGISRAYYTGENAAMARSTASSVMNSWMNSSGHKANILDSNYQRIGIGVVYQNGYYYWIQIFDSLSSSNIATLKTDTQSVQRSIKVSSEITIGSTSTNTINLESDIKTVSLHVDETQEITIKNANATTVISYAILDTDNNFSYSSSDSDVAIYENGKIVSKGAGTAEVSVYLTDYPDSKVTFNVTVSAHEYDSGVVTLGPTCEDKGVMTYTCTICGHTHTEDIDALGHYFVSVVTDPNCDEQGYTTHTCTRCGDNYTDSYVDALGHVYATEAIGATCTEQGYIIYTCTRCGDTYKANYTDALGHDYVSVVTAPICESGGYTTHTCTRCGDSYTDSYVAALGHDYVEVVTDPTCEEVGYITRTCTRCGDSEIYIYIAALGHDYIEVSRLEPTCEVDGNIVYECTICGDIKIETIPALGHEWVEISRVEPTCNEDGYIEYECAICGEIYTETLSALGHSWGEWTVVTEATETADGLEQRVCSVCGEVETRAIPATGTSNTDNSTINNTSSSSTATTSNNTNGNKTTTAKTGDFNLSIIFAGAILASLVIVIISRKKLSK